MTAAAPLSDRLEAIERLLYARGELEAVRDSTLPGTALYVAMESAIRSLSVAIWSLR